MSVNSPKNPSSETEPEIITDLSELSFDFEDATPSSRPPVYGSVTSLPGAEHLSVEVELLDSLAGQITGDGQPEFYCKPLGQLLGPMSLAELRVMAESGALAGDDLVRFGESGEWKPAETFARLAESLHRGSTITAEPVSSAPPSTRRLFQTGFKPTGDSFVNDQSAVAEKNEVPVAPEVPTSQMETSKNDSTVEAKSSGPTVEKSDAPKIGSAESAEAKEASESQDADNKGKVKDPRQKKGAKKSKGASGKKSEKKAKAAKKAAKKRKDEDDALLSDIFSEVFADDQKGQRSPMPPAAGPTSGSDQPAASPPSATESGDAKPKTTPAAS